MLIVTSFRKIEATYLQVHRLPGTVRARNGMYRTDWGALTKAFIQFYCVDQKYYYYLRDDEIFSFYACYMARSSLLRRMGKCQER